jgi:hypothetical protein
MAEETQKPAPAREAAKETVVAAEKTVKAVDKEGEKAAAEQPLERRTAQDFEVGGTEEMFLPGGSTADLVEREWQEREDKIRSEQAGQLVSTGNLAPDRGDEVD